MCIHLLAIPPVMTSQPYSECSVSHLCYTPCFGYIFLVFIYLLHHFFLFL